VTPLSLALRALPFTFVVYVLQALLASFVALPGGIELARSLRASSWDRVQWARLLDALPDVAAVGRSSALSALIAAVVLLVLGPWLQMSWLAALDELCTPLRALARGARVTVRAWLVSLLVLLVLVLGCAPFLLIGYSLHVGLGSSSDSRFHDLTVALVLSPIPLVALFAHTLHDLARARALYRGALDALVKGMRAALSLRLLLRSLALWLLGVALVVAAQRLASWADGPFRFVLTVAVLQSALLGRLFVRSIWLGDALACVLPDHGPLAGQTARAKDE
jgi:hypothetical protein